MGVGVAEGSEAIVVFLAGSIPQRKLDVLAIDLDIGNIVLNPFPIYVPFTFCILVIVQSSSNQTVPDEAWQ